MNVFPSSALMIHFKDYERYHQTQGNKVLHYIGIPGVVFSLLGLLAHVTVFQVNLGLVLLLVGTVYAFKTDAKFAIPYSLATCFFYLVARDLSLTTLAIIQALAWGTQFYGHFVYEKKSPAFFNQLEHLLIGPMWIFAHAIGYYRDS